MAKVNGAAVRVIVERTGLTWGEYAELVGKSRTHISHIVAGRKDAPWRTVKAMADALRVPVVAILANPDEKAS